MMKKSYYWGVALLVLLEVFLVYFIMPMPGSQANDTLDFAYWVYQWRWFLRSVFGACLVLGLIPAFRSNKWLALAGILLTGLVVYLFNFVMLAEKMFYQPSTLAFAGASANRVPQEKLVMGVSINGSSKAYPIQFLSYHHQVRDIIGGQPVMVTYCSVCRSGRVFDPTVNGHEESFRLVGMDHFNAMFEDMTTRSWWQQETGEAVAGPLKGYRLKELQMVQTGLSEWLRCNPESLVMQADSAFSKEYDDMASYDIGLGRGKLTRTDTIPWEEKSWVVGIEVGPKNAKAFDWARLKRERIIQENVGSVPVLLVLAQDDRSFFAFQRPQQGTIFSLNGDTIQSGNQSWNIMGDALDDSWADLDKINAYQEFWHSWRTFHPHTTKY